MRDHFGDEVRSHANAAEAIVILVSSFGGRIHDEPSRTD